MSITAKLDGMRLKCYYIIVPRVEYSVLCCLEWSLPTLFDRKGLSVSSYISSVQPSINVGIFDQLASAFGAIQTLIPSDYADDIQPLSSEETRGINSKLQKLTTEMAHNQPDLVCKFAIEHEDQHACWFRPSKKLNQLLREYVSVSVSSYCLLYSYKDPTFRILIGYDVNKKVIALVAVQTIDCGSAMRSITLYQPQPEDTLPKAPGWLRNIGIDLFSLGLS